MKLVPLLLFVLPVAAQEASLQQLAKTYQSLTTYSAEFIYIQPSDSITALPPIPFAIPIHGLHRKVWVHDKKSRLEMLTSTHEITIMDGMTIWQVWPRNVWRRPQGPNNEPFEVTLLRNLDRVKTPQFLPDETITVEGMSHQCTVITGELGQVATIWIDKATGLAVKVSDGPYTLLVLQFTRNDKAAEDDSLYTYTPPPGALVFEYPK